jgi:hypothetical protein
LIVLPEPALAPVMLPVMVPIVQVNVLATSAVNAMFGATPLHAVWVFAVVTVGVVEAVTVMGVETAVQFVLSETDTVYVAAVLTVGF